MVVINYIDIFTNIIHQNYTILDKIKYFFRVFLTDTVGQDGG